MKTQQVWNVGRVPIRVTETFNQEEMQLLEYFATYSNAIIKGSKESETIVGDPTEVAIIRLLHEKDLTKEILDIKYPRVYELPFDSTHKKVTTIHQVENDFISITKGVFDRISVLFTDELLKKATEIHAGFASQALRVIAIGYKIYTEMPSDLSEGALEKDLTFLGMVGMIDPPRPKVKRPLLERKKRESNQSR